VSIKEGALVGNNLGFFLGTLKQTGKHILRSTSKQQQVILATSQSAWLLWYGLNTGCDTF